MSTVQLEAGGLLPAKTRVDAEATEQIVARSYQHPALGDRAVIRLASDRLGKAEDLAMEFLGFEAPAVSAAIALQQRRSLSFAAWALINDPKNARYALDLVKKMKKTARQARSKPGHAWDAYVEMAKDLGRSARHFLPPYWEEVGRAFKDLGNQTYAGRALNKSLEAERVHALESDRARRRDVVLEFVLSGCLAGSALSDYGNDLQNHYPPAEAFAIFRDLCVRRTRGGMSPWANLPKDFIKLAKAAGLDGDRELESWLEEVIEAPAMGRPSYQFWKTCSNHCQRIVERNPDFAMALLRHTRPEPRYYGESNLPPWVELLEEWGVLEFLWEDGHKGTPPLGEPIADWFGRIIRDDNPAPKLMLEMLAKLAPRLRRENKPLALSIRQRWGNGGDIDIDVLEACLVQGIKVDDPPPRFAVTFAGWLSAEVDHPLRNQDIALAWKDDRFQDAVFQGLNDALGCRGGTLERGYRKANLSQRAFPLAAGDRPGIKELWRQHTEAVIASLEDTGLASFEMARARLEATLWPDTLRLFPDLAERLNHVDPVTMLRRTLQAGVFDEYGLPAFEQTVDQASIKIEANRFGDTNLHLTFPSIAVSDKIHAHIIHSDGTIKKHELRLPKNVEVRALIPVGDDLAVGYRNAHYQTFLHWGSDPAQQHDCGYFYASNTAAAATTLKDGSVFLGVQAVRPGDKNIPMSQPYIHDGERFWRLTQEYDHSTQEHHWHIHEVDPQTGKQLRASVPPWFEETEGGTLEPNASELLPAPAGAEESPLGTKGGMLGWKAIKRRDGSYFGVGIDGRRWDQPLRHQQGQEAAPAIPVGLLRQPGTDQYLPVTIPGGRGGNYWLWDATGATVIAMLEDFSTDYAGGQVSLLPMRFWHLLKVRDETSSQRMRAISEDECRGLLEAAAVDRAQQAGPGRSAIGTAQPNPLVHLLPAVKKLLPTAPDRMLLGIARLANRAEGVRAAFLDLRDKANAESKQETKRSSLVTNRKSDVAAAHWGLPSFYTYGKDDNISVSGHLTASAAFLKGESKAGDLPRTNFVWFSMLEDLPLRSWQTFWRATAAMMSQKEAGETPWLEFLKHWHESGIADLPGQFDIMEGVPEGAKKNNWGGYDIQVSGGTSFTLHNGDDRFIVIETDGHSLGSSSPYHFLRYSTGQTPAKPPGYEVKNVRTIKEKPVSASVAAFIAAAEASTELPVPSKDELAEVAGRLSASPAEIGLIWLGGLNLDNYQSNFLPAELRAALGWKTTDANAGRQALRNLNSSVLSHLYEAVVSQGPAAAFAADRKPVLRLIEKAWQSKMPKRLQLDAALQTRLAALGKTSRWQRREHEEVLAMASEPAKHPLLQPREIEIKVDKVRNYNGLQLIAKDKGAQAIDADALKSIVQLVALVHADTPAGHPARADMPALIKQATKLLDHSSTLLNLRSLHLYDYGRKKPLKPAEWLSKHVGKVKANPKDSTSRFEDSLLSAATLDSNLQVLVAFRPAKLKDKADLARLQAIMAIDVGEQYDSPRNDSVPIVAAIKSPGFQKLLKAIVSKGVPDGQWRQNPEHTAAAVIASIRKKRKLSNEAAVLYAQLLALPDPTMSNVCTWNGWTAAQMKKAAADLVKQKLVLEAVRSRAGRSAFLPGEWLDLKAPWLPIESWKLAHLVEHGLDAGEPCPAGGPMVLRPFEDLFTAAWERVLDGDEPRYEEVKRKKRNSHGQEESQ